MNSIIYKEIKENAEFYEIDPIRFKYDEYVIADEYVVNPITKFNTKLIDNVKYIIENYGNTKKFIEERRIRVPIDSLEFFFFYFLSHLFSYPKSNFNNEKNYIDNCFITTKKIYEQMKDGFRKNTYKEFSKDIYESIMNDYKNNVFVMKNSVYHNEYVENNNTILNLSRFNCAKPLAMIPRRYLKKVDDNKMN